jgi:hypothetical protein
VEVSGLALPRAELEAPRSGERCLLYRVVLGLLQRLREGGGRAHEVAGASFLLQSSSGLLLVEPDAARLYLPTRLRGRLPLGQEAAGEARLRALYQRLARGVPPPTVRGREQRLEAGDWVRAAGWLEERPHPRGAPRGYRRPPCLPVLHAEELRVCAGAQKALVSLPRSPA